MLWSFDCRLASSFSSESVLSGETERLAQRNKNDFFYIHLKIGFKHNNSNDCFFFLKIRLERKIMKGKLYGIGVGPGDPELLTLKAKRLIEECDIVAVPVKKKAKIVSL